LEALGKRRVRENKIKHSDTKTYIIILGDRKRGWERKRENAPAKWQAFTYIPTHIHTYMYELKHTIYFGVFVFVFRWTQKISNTNCAFENGGDFLYIY